MKWVKFGERIKEPRTRTPGLIHSTMEKNWHSEWLNDMTKDRWGYEEKYT